MRKALKVGAGAAAAAGYVVLALWAKATYVDPMPRPDAVQILRPFYHEAGLAWRVAPADPSVTVYRDRRPLRLADNFAEISKTAGMFFREGGLFISADGDPNKDGHFYWAVKP